MPILLAYGIIALSVIAIMYNTYLGYGEYHWFLKILFTLFLIVSVSAPIINFSLRHYDFSGLWQYIPKILYFFFGFVFFCFVMTLMRDIIWAVTNLICRIPLAEMKNPEHLKLANILTFIICFSICFYGLYEAEKDSEVVSYDIVSPKIKQKTKMVMLSDLHIDKTVSSDYVKNLVARVNALKPDVVVLVGDIIDNMPNSLAPQMEELQKLQATDGVYVTLGNHEFYVDPLSCAMGFGQMGFNILNNTGQRLEQRGIHIAGIPDINNAMLSKMKVKIENALYYASNDDYVVMLSHAPKVVAGMTKDNIDLILSGHTHGGQIFPFHYLAKTNNDGHLAGFYDVNGIKMYVSRGTRYWGPPLRILAPSEITVFNFLPKDKNAE